MPLNVDNEAIKVIDNNDVFTEKTITFFKDIGQIDGSGNICGILKLNHVKNGYIAYDFKEYYLSYRLVSKNYSTGSFPKGLEVITMRDGKVIKQEDVLINSSFNKIMGNAVIYTFEHQEFVDLIIKFKFDYGWSQYYLYRTPSSTHCCGSKCSGGDPVYKNTNLYKYIDLKITYNTNASAGERFYNFSGEFDEIKEESGIFNFKREFEIPDENIKQIKIGINENKALEFALYNPNWAPVEDSLKKSNYNDGPCLRVRSIGKLLREEINEFRDYTHGELPEEPYVNDVINENNITSSDIYKIVNITNSENIFNINDYTILSYNYESKNLISKLQTFIEKRGNKYYLIINYNFVLPKINGYDNDKIRFKSKFDIGAIILLK